MNTCGPEQGTLVMTGQGIHHVSTTKLWNQFHMKHNEAVKRCEERTEHLPSYHSIKLSCGLCTTLVRKQDRGCQGPLLALSWPMAQRGWASRKTKRRVLLWLYASEIASPDHSTVRWAWTDAASVFCLSSTPLTWLPSPILPVCFFKSLVHAC